MLLAAWAGLQLSGATAHWVAVVAASWGFHVAVDRALGFGLKLGPFAHTHLGALGKKAESPTAPESANR